ncbi:MAG: DsrE family protein [Thiohalobacterales bacterium]|nr:DsrE family protein [Thiohalobacterales bacterium]
MNTAANIVEFEQEDIRADEPLVVILASGPEDDGKRATLAYSAAVTSLGMDTPTRLFLVGDGAFWAYEGHTSGFRMPGFPALSDLVEAFSELGGETWICSTCDQFCGVPSDGHHGGRSRRPDVQPRGMASILPEVAMGSSITF